MSTLAFEVDARGVATITLNRPEKHNSLTPQLIGEISQACERAHHDQSIRVVIVTGAGASFCAGADLEQMRAMASATREENYADALALGQCLRQLDELPKPCIAKVNGSAFGGGLGLIACADIAIGSSNAKFALTEVKLGLLPAVISRHVVAAIGVRHSRRLFLNAAVFDANEAKSVGLLHAVTTPEMLDAAVEEEVARLLKGAPGAQRAAKELLKRIASDDAQLLRERESFTAKLLAEVRAGPEAQAGIAAFFAKRSPPWDSRS